MSAEPESMGVITQTWDRSEVMLDEPKSVEIPQPIETSLDLHHQHDQERERLEQDQSDKPTWPTAYYLLQNEYNNVQLFEATLTESSQQKSLETLSNTKDPDLRRMLFYELDLQPFEHQTWTHDTANVVANTLQEHGVALSTPLDTEDQRLHVLVKAEDGINVVEAEIPQISLPSADEVPTQQIEQNVLKKETYEPSRTVENTTETIGKTYRFTMQLMRTASGFQFCVDGKPHPGILHDDPRIQRVIDELLASGSSTDQQEEYGCLTITHYSCEDDPTALEIGGFTDVDILSESNLLEEQIEESTNDDSDSPAEQVVAPNEDEPPPAETPALSDSSYGEDWLLAVQWDAEEIAPIIQSTTIAAPTELLKEQNDFANRIYTETHEVLSEYPSPVATENRSNLAPIQGEQREVLFDIEHVEPVMPSQDLPPGDLPIVPPVPESLLHRTLQEQITEITPVFSDQTAPQHIDVSTQTSVTSPAKARTIATTKVENDQIPNEVTHKIQEEMSILLPEEPNLTIGNANNTVLPIPSMPTALTDKVLEQVPIEPPRRPTNQPPKPPEPQRIEIPKRVSKLDVTAAQRHTKQSISREQQTARLNNKSNKHEVAKQQETTRTTTQQAVSTKLEQAEKQEKSSGITTAKHILQKEVAVEKEKKAGTLHKRSTEFVADRKEASKKAVTATSRVQATVNNSTLQITNSRKSIKRRSQTKKEQTIAAPQGSHEDVQSVLQRSFDFVHKRAEIDRKPMQIQLLQGTKAQILQKYIHPLSLTIEDISRTVQRFPSITVLAEPSSEAVLFIPSTTDPIDRAAFLTAMQKQTHHLLLDANLSLRFNLKG